MHHGVATLSKVPLAEERRFDWQDNGEARHIGVRLPNGLLLENVYVPAGGDMPDPALNPKFAQKLAFVDRMTRWSEGLRDDTRHRRRLQHRAARMRRVEPQGAAERRQPHAGRGRPAERRSPRATTGSTSAARFVPAPERLYTWWSYRNADHTVNDRGRRLDHIWASPAVGRAATGFEVVEDARLWGKPSDHVPQIATFDL